MLEARVEVEEDDEAVVEALPADAPLVDQRLGVAVGLLGRDAVVDDLGVDDDLGAGPLLDRVDRRLGRGDRLRREDAGVVVDRPVDLRVGNGGPGGDRGAGPPPAVADARRARVTIPPSVSIAPRSPAGSASTARRGRRR